MKEEFDWITENAPCIRMNGSEVHVIYEPQEFFQNLKNLSGLAKKRIVLSSLYLGTGALEQDLVSCLRDSLKNNKDNEDFRMSILLDHSRATRGEENSCTMLDSLFRVQSDTSKLQVRLFHTPYLRGFLKQILPSRWNEIIGVQHMKLYIFDDSVLISGANLSDSYFTNRQDRYVLVENCKDLADYYCEIVSAVSSCSFQLDATGMVRLSDQCTVHPYEGSQIDFAKMMNERVDKVKSAWIGRQQEGTKPVQSSAECDTKIYPLIQMGLCNINQEDEVITRTFSTDSSQSTVNLASGYFNLTSEYSQLLLRNGTFKLNILSASPQANGFFNGHGISYYVPAFYTCVAKSFFANIERLKQCDRISLFEYARPNWTFHAKGLWWTSPGEKLPSATFVGSSNFGYRSVRRDLEAQLVIVTRNAGLQHQLFKEQQRLLGVSVPVEPATFLAADHHVPLMVLLQALIVGRIVLDKLRPLVPRMNRAAEIHVHPVRSSRILCPESRDRFLRRERATAGNRNKKRLHGRSSVSDEDWIPIYRFNLIGPASILSRLKLYQTIFVTVFLVPGTAVAYSQNAVSMTFFQSSVVFGVCSLALLYVMTSFSQRLVGVISVDCKGEIVRIGYLNFWGRRRNAVVPLEDVIPLSDTNAENTKKMYINLEIQDFKQKLYLPIRYIEVVEPEIFKDIFGEFSPLDKASEQKKEKLD